MHFLFIIFINIQNLSFVKHLNFFVKNVTWALSLVFIWWIYVTIYSQIFPDSCCEGNFSQKEMTYSQIWACLDFQVAIQTNYYFIDKNGWRNISKSNVSFINSNLIQNKDWKKKSLLRIKLIKEEKIISALNNRILTFKIALSKIKSVPKWKRTRQIINEYWFKYIF